MSFIDRTQKQPDVVPPDFRTIKQWVKHLDKSRRVVSEAIDEGLEQGIVIEKIFMVRSGRRGIYPTPHYKELPDDTHATTQTQPTSNGDRQHPAPNKPQHGQGFTRRQNAGREAKAIRRA